MILMYELFGEIFVILLYKEKKLVLIFFYVRNFLFFSL